MIQDTYLLTTPPYVNRTRILYLRWPTVAFADQSPGWSDPSRKNTILAIGQLGKGVRITDPTILNSQMPKLLAGADNTDLSFRESSDISKKLTHRVKVAMARCPCKTGP
jgi:hypothetical protein